MKIERDARIAPTAHYTAYVWHRLGLPHAELFTTATGRRLFWTFRLSGEWLATLAPGVPSMEQYLELRHRSIEHALAEAAPDRVVELGAGLSRRGITWAADRGVDYVEVDLPHMVRAKRDAIRERAPAALRAGSERRLRHLALDVLAPSFGDELAALLGGAARPVVIAEGLLGYFDPAERARIVGGVACGLRAAGGGGFLCDLRSGEGGASIAAAARVLRGAIWIATRGRGARADFASPDAVREFLREHGFSSVDDVPAARAVPRLAHLRTPARVWWARL